MILLFPALHEFFNDEPEVLKFIAHGRRAVAIARSFGWLPGARYTNLRDVREEAHVGFLDINWKKYDFDRHLDAAKMLRPFLSVARDLESIDHLESILEEATQLADYCHYVVIVPKDTRLAEQLQQAIPEQFLLGYSVPTRYGKTQIPPEAFVRPTHLLGGRPDIQRKLAEIIPVVSLDCNRFTLDASFGDYFDGTTFRPHPTGGYVTCIEDSLSNINDLWKSYRLCPGAKKWLAAATSRLRARKVDESSC